MKKEKKGLIEKKFRVCIASRYMYDDYREYNVYIGNATNIEIAKKWASDYVKYLKLKDVDHTTSYEVFSVEEEI